MKIHLHLSIFLYTITFSLSGHTTVIEEDTFIHGINPSLTEQERKGLSISEAWTEGKKDSFPIEGEEGTILFLFGVNQPSVVCAIMQVCDIALEPGEIIHENGLHIGDKARWSVIPSVSGTGIKKQTHLIIKPLGSIGNTTSLFVATDKRTYHIKLVSHRTEYMPKVAFHYPEDAKQAWEEYYSRAQQEVEIRTLPETKENIAKLDFEYEITGKTRWKPLRVYNNGIKTIIQLPPTVKQTEAPTLLILGADDKEHIVNYRLRDNRYIVDQVFHKAILIAGVGSHQEKITIIKK